MEEISAFHKVFPVAQLEHDIFCLLTKNDTRNLVEGKQVISYTWQRNAFKIP